MSQVSHFVQYIGHHMFLTHRNLLWMYPKSRCSHFPHCIRHGKCLTLMGVSQTSHSLHNLNHRKRLTVIGALWTCPKPSVSELEGLRVRVKEDVASPLRLFNTTDVLLSVGLSAEDGPQSRGAANEAWRPKR